MTILRRTPIVSVIDDRLRTTSICLCADYGSRDDPPGLGGLAHLWEHLLMSAPGEAGVSFCEHVERLGGQANAETGLERMLFYAQVHSDDADDVAAALVRAIDQPSLTAARLASERAVVLQELAAAAADPADVVQDAFLATLFADHPLGRPVGGTPEEIGAVSTGHLLAAHEERLCRRPMTIVVVGPRIPAPFAADALPSAEATTADPPPQERVRVPVSGLGPSSTGWPDEFAWVCVGGRSAPLGEPGREAYTVLAHLLGGSPSSLLYRRLRTELGLAYSFQAWDRGYTEAGAWRVMVGVDPANGDQAVSTVVDLLKEAASAGPLPEDLDAARRQARMRLLLDLETPLEHARTVAQRMHPHLTTGSVEDELRAYELIGGEDVRAAATGILDTLVTVVRPGPST